MMNSAAAKAKIIVMVHLPVPNASPLTSVFYVSRARVPKDEVQSIVEMARVANATLGLTGGLLYTGNFFAQVLEGATATVQEKMATIRVDSRHDHVTQIAGRAVRLREYPKWTMGYIAAPAADRLIAQMLDDSFAFGKGTELRELLLEWISGGV